MDYPMAPSMKKNSLLVAAASQMKIQLANAFDVAGRVKT